ncbi:MAG: CPBP family glutamic-type intramembrane protease [Candidatus Limnocylindrales bacterium]
MSVPVNELRTLMAIALAGLLLLLRLDAPRFASAEYDADQADDSPGGIATRLAWPVLAILLAAGVAVLLPAGRSAIGLGGATFLSGTTIVGALLGSAAGVLVVVGLARLRAPDQVPRPGPARRVPRLALDAAATAVVDELTFRGVLLGLLLLAGLPPGVAFLVQLLVYGLATRLGQYTVTLGLLGEALGLGVLTGLLALATGGIAAPLVAHAVTRFTALAVPGALPPIVPRQLA